MAERKKKTSTRKTPALKTPKRKAGAVKNTVTAGDSEVPSKEGPEVKVEVLSAAPQLETETASPEPRPAQATALQQLMSNNTFRARVISRLVKRLG